MAVVDFEVYVILDGGEDGDKPDGAICLEPFVPIVGA
jgi:hypothetical protein